MHDDSLLEGALLGFQKQLEQIDRTIADLQSQMRGEADGPSWGTARPVRRGLGPAARKRIADAQKLRWAEFHKRKQRERR